MAPRFHELTFETMSNEYWEAAWVPLPTGYVLEVLRATAANDANYGRYVLNVYRTTSVKVAKWTMPYQPICVVRGSDKHYLDRFEAQCTYYDLLQYPQGSQVTRTIPSETGQGEA